MISLVSLQPFFQSVACCSSSRSQLEGLLNYHGEHLPVVDVSSWLGYGRAPKVLSTRIAIVEAEFESYDEHNIASQQTVDHSKGQTKTTKKLGLILDRAYETTYLPDAVDVSTPSAFVQGAFEGSDGLLVKRLAIAPLVNQIHQVQQRYSVT